MNNVKAIIFDMDGVLIDSERLCMETWKIASAEFGHPDYEDVIAGCRGTNKEYTRSFLKKVWGEDFDSVSYLNRTSFLFHKMADEGKLLLKPYVKEALEYLSKKYTLLIASSTREVIVRKELTNFGIIHYFKTITTGDMVTKSKPDPEIYLKALSSLSLEAEDCIAVEDSFNGIRSAWNAGLRTMMVIDLTQPDEEIKKLCYKVYDDLGQLIKDL